MALEKILNRNNAFFDTYYIYDTENRKFIGIIEDHYIAVMNRYYISIKYKNNDFIPDSRQIGKPKMFDTYEEALEYIQEDYSI